MSGSSICSIVQLSGKVTCDRNEVTYLDRWCPVFRLRQSLQASRSTTWPFMGSCFLSLCWLFLTGLWLSSELVCVAILGRRFPAEDGASWRSGRTGSEYLIRSTGPVNATVEWMNTVSIKKMNTGVFAFASLASHTTRINWFKYISSESDCLFQPTTSKRKETWLVCTMLAILPLSKPLYMLLHVT